jgi:hypothetical protein
MRPGPRIASKVFHRAGQLVRGATSPCSIVPKAPWIWPICASSSTASPRVFRPSWEMAVISFIRSPMRAAAPGTKANRAAIALYRFGIAGLRPCEYCVPSGFPLRTASGWQRDNLGTRPSILSPHFYAGRTAGLAAQCSPIPRPPGGSAHAVSRSPVEHSGDAIGVPMALRLPRQCVHLPMTAEGALAEERSNCSCRRIVALGAGTLRHCARRARAAAANSQGSCGHRSPPFSPGGDR